MRMTPIPRTLAILLSTWLRKYIGYTWWRRVHVLTLVGYLLVTLHGLATGTDTRTWWGFLIYGGSVALIGCLVWARLMEPATARARKHPLIAAVVGCFIAGVALWALLGPLQANWGTLAGSIAPSTSAP